MELTHNTVVGFPTYECHNFLDLEFLRVLRRPEDRKAGVALIKTTLFQRKPTPQTASSICCWLGAHVDCGYLGIPLAIAPVKLSGPLSKPPPPGPEEVPLPRRFRSVIGSLQSWVTAWVCNH
ncbi:hypothetical protein J6590_031446 [Homalodisca vitripennis]|nr:hypothetical protein J6590_031446 [Homalodisca vitripennis]